MQNATITTAQINGHWHMIVEERSGRTEYPAASKTEAEIMARVEKRRRGMPTD